MERCNIATNGVLGLGFSRYDYKIVKASKQHTTYDQEIHFYFVYIFNQYAGSEPNATFLSLRPGDQLSNTTLNTPTGGVNMRIMQDEKTL